MSEKSLKERFQEKLDGSRWTGSTNNIGYPKMKVDGEMVLGSHVALRLAGRKAPTGGPAGGNIVMHKDNNKLNLSPSNLEVGTHKENLKQMRDEGRDRPRGVHQEPDEKVAIDIRRAVLPEMGSVMGKYLNPAQVAANPLASGLARGRPHLLVEKPLSELRAMAGNMRDFAGKPELIDQAANALQKNTRRHELTHYLRGKAGKMEGVGQPGLRNVLRTGREELIAYTKGVDAFDKMGPQYVSQAAKGVIPGAMASVREAYPQGVAHAALGGTLKPVRDLAQRFGLMKQATVKGPIKAYRRALSLFNDDGHFHSTSPKNLASMAKDKFARTGYNNVYGPGVYFERGKPNSFGNAALALSPERAASVGLEKFEGRSGLLGTRPVDWSIHRSDSGLPLSNKDYLVHLNNQGDDAKLLADAAREHHMRHIPHAELMSARFVAQGDSPASGAEKRIMERDKLKKQDAKFYAARAIARAKAKAALPAATVPSAPAPDLPRVVGSSSAVSASPPPAIVGDGGHLNDVVIKAREPHMGEVSGWDRGSVIRRRGTPPSTAPLSPSLGDALADPKLFKEKLKDPDRVWDFGGSGPTVPPRTQSSAAPPPAPSASTTSTAPAPGRSPLPYIAGAGALAVGGGLALRHHLKKKEEAASWKTASTDIDILKFAFKLQGHTEFQGIPIAIENRKGSVRKGTDRDGKPWRTVMKMPYGFVKGTKGADGEEIDCYIGSHKNAPNVYAVHQHKSDGTGYDEDKLIFGVRSKEEASKRYLQHYNSDKFLGPVKEVPVERLKEMLSTGKKLEKISTSLCARVLRRG